MAGGRGLLLLVGGGLVLCNVKSLVNDLWYWLDLCL